MNLTIFIFSAIVIATSLNSDNSNYLYVRIFITVICVYAMYFSGVQLEKKLFKKNKKCG